MIPARYPSANNLPAEVAERQHDCGELSVNEQALIEVRAKQIVEEQLGCRQEFYSLLEGIDHELHIYPHLHRALMNLDTEIRGGNGYSRGAVLDALTEIQRVVRPEAQRLWLDSAMTQAEDEVLHDAAPVEYVT
jgi:hypothetical protein